MLKPKLFTSILRLCWGNFGIGSVHASNKTAREDASGTSILGAEVGYQFNKNVSLLMDLEAMRYHCIY